MAYLRRCNKGHVTHKELQLNWKVCNLLQFLSASIFSRKKQHFNLFLLLQYTKSSKIKCSQGLNLDKYLRTQAHDIYPLVLFMRNDSWTWTICFECQVSDVLQPPSHSHPGLCWTYAVLALTLPLEIQENVLSLDTVATAASAGHTWDQESGDAGPGAVSSFDERDLSTSYVSTPCWFAFCSQM